MIIKAYYDTIIQYSLLIVLYRQSILQNTPQDFSTLKLSKLENPIPQISHNVRVFMIVGTISIPQSGNHPQTPSSSTNPTLPSPDPNSPTSYSSTNDSKHLQQQPSNHHVKRHTPSFYDTLLDNGELSDTVKAAQGTIEYFKVEEGKIEKIGLDEIVEELGIDSQCGELVSDIVGESRDGSVGSMEEIAIMMKSITHNEMKGDG